MKTVGRSLEALGVGKLGLFVLHVHNSQPAAAAVAAAELSSSNTNNTTSMSFRSISLSSSSTASSLVSSAYNPVAPALPPQQRIPSQRHRDPEVVDLAESDDEEEEVCIVELPAAAPVQKRRRVV